MNAYNEFHTSTKKEKQAWAAAIEKEVACARVIER